ncbi:MAG: rod shape-determining protein MreC [Gammaproteobacteria bacterium]|nr:rod shape-determining protein MreC [Gammaproteobacteria bacterium]MDH3362736.1 rod shape-determining protein MreC [Gammaproteobacteria bacterium]MDH3480651.1 rod shape-determining protein MreC [Gammaproteobacteria bacterium]
MVASRGKNRNPARIPALGLRLLVLIMISMVLMYLDHREKHLDAVRKGIGAAVYPVQLIVDAPFRLWSWLAESTVSRNELQLEVDRLNAERLLTNARLQRLTALEAENARLRALLDARARVRDEVRVAEIMAVDANPYEHNLIIDIGSRDGVFDGQAIVSADGVVGQVIKAGLKTAQAVLISDADHALPVEVNRNGLRTIAVGTGEIDRLDLPFLPNNADIRAGDLLVTSGLGGAFPAGYPVATVDAVTRIPQEPFANVTAKPAAALDQVREVMLVWSPPPIVKEQNDE